MRSASGSWLSAVLLPWTYLQRFIHTSNTPQPPYRIPAEWESHRRTLMGWPDRISVEREDQLHHTWTEIVDIAETIARFEPVWIYSSHANAKSAKAWIASANITVKIAQVEQPWMRSIGPLLAHSADGELVGVNMHSSYEDHTIDSLRQRDAAFAARIMQENNFYKTQTDATLKAELLELDSAGTLLAMDDLVSYNEAVSETPRYAIERALFDTLGVKHIIWLPGSSDITPSDRSIDSLARLAPNNTVLLSRPNVGIPRDDPAWRIYQSSKETLQAATNAGGHRMRIVEIEEAFTVPLASFDRHPTKRPTTSYLGYYLVNGAVIVPQFGEDRANDEARRVLKGVWPEREVVSVKVNFLACMGGGVHSATMQWPLMDPGRSRNGDSATAEIREDEL